MNALAAIILLWPTGDVAECRATRAIDGDSVEVACLDWPQMIRLRIYGIDTPERGELGYSEATDAMTKLLEAQALAGFVVDTDRYGRLVTRLQNHFGLDLSCAMVRGGWAIPYPDPRYHDGRYDECAPLRPMPSEVGQ